jgi:4-hydroxybenzoate polyprenyltransferase
MVQKFAQGAPARTDTDQLVRCQRPLPALEPSSLRPHRARLTASGEGAVPSHEDSRAFAYFSSVSATIIDVAVERARSCLLSPLIRLCRPHQYLKNGFVLVGVIFSGGCDVSLAARALVAFVAFCALASAVYIGNDIVDREADRSHALKKDRPLASGAVSVRVARGLGLTLAAIAFGLAALLGPKAVLLLLLYAMINIGYSLWWKHLAVIDVFLISAGFMLRLLVGTIGIGLAPSSWLLICGFMLTLFLGFAKRRAELMTTLSRRASDPSARRVLDDYTPDVVQQFMTMSAACAILSYTLYTLAPDTIARHHTNMLVLTVPFVVYGVFRYFYLVHRRQSGQDVARDLLADTQLVVVCAGWVAVTLLVFAAANGGLTGLGAT